jgi:hypothetical protein
MASLLGMWRESDYSLAFNIQHSTFKNQQSKFNNRNLAIANRQSLNGPIAQSPNQGGPIALARLGVV